MPRWLILTATHILVLSIGFAGGIYLLPILTAPPSPTEVALQNSASERSIWVDLRAIWKAVISSIGAPEKFGIAPDRIAHLGRLSPGPDYKVYLAPRFVETKAAFLEIKGSSVRLGDVKTFNGFIVAGAQRRRC